MLKYAPEGKAWDGFCVASKLNGVELLERREIGRRLLGTGVLTPRLAELPRMMGTLFTHNAMSIIRGGIGTMQCADIDQVNEALNYLYVMRAL